LRSSASRFPWRHVRASQPRSAYPLRLGAASPSARGSSLSVLHPRCSFFTPKLPFSAAGRLGQSAQLRRPEAPQAIWRRQRFCNAAGFLFLARKDHRQTFAANAIANGLAASRRSFDLSSVFRNRAASREFTRVLVAHQFIFASATSVSPRATACISLLDKQIGRPCVSQPLSFGLGCVQLHGLRIRCGPQ